MKIFVVYSNSGGNLLVDAVIFNHFHERLRVTLEDIASTITVQWHLVGRANL